MAINCSPIRMEHPEDGDHYYLDKDDECLYLGEYIPQELLEPGQAIYDASEINQIIINIKKTPSKARINPYVSKYKRQDIGRIGRCLWKSINMDFLNNQVTLIPVPPSKSKSHPDYDDRMLQICSLAHSLEGVTNADVLDILSCDEDFSSSHSGGNRQSIDSLVQNYSFDCNASPREIVFIVDDVITTGRHFKACKQVILENYPDVKRVVGYFIGKVKREHVDPFEGFDIF